MDERSRQLQRTYRGGDTAVAGQLLRMMVSANQIRNCEVDFLAMLGFYPAIESRRLRVQGTLEEDDYLEIPLRDNDFMWRQLGKYISLHIVIAAHIYPFKRIFNHHPDWCDIIRQDHPEWDESTCDLFKDLIEQQLFGLQNCKIGSLSPIKPFNQLNSLFIKKRGKFHISLAVIAENQDQQNSRPYWLLWHLLSTAERLKEIREITKGKRNYVEKISNWFKDIEDYWMQEAVNFEYYLPGCERISINQAREELYNYLLPRAIELILL